MPFLVWHSSLGASLLGVKVPCLEPHLPLASSTATSQKCPPTTSWPSSTATACAEPEVSRTQLRSPPAPLSNSAKKSLPPAARYSLRPWSTTEWPNESVSASVTQEASCLPSVLSLTSALDGLPSTASHTHAAQIV